MQTQKGIIDSTKEKKIVRLPITICSSKKTKVKRGYPYRLYNSKRIKSFTEKYGGFYIILSRTHGLMFSDIKYNQYSDLEMLPDRQLLEVLKKQANQYPELYLYFYNPRPLTGDKWFILLEKARFNVKEFRCLKDFDLSQYIHYNELEGYNNLLEKIKKINKQKKSMITLEKFW